MSVHHYPPKALAGDYLRAGVGFALTAGPALLLEPAPVVTGILALLATLFGAFGLRTATRQLTVVEATEDAIACRGPVGKKFSWGEVENVRLDYFSTRRDGREGWMQMKIVGSRGRIRIDSTIENFPRLAATIASVASEAPIAMTDTTLGNFRALGIAVPTQDQGAGL